MFLERGPVFSELGYLGTQAKVGGKLHFKPYTYGISFKDHTQ